MSTQSLISVIVPCYNVEEYLNKAIESIVAQTYTNWECILINDGSTDSTQSIAEKWVAKDQRIKLINQKNQGLSGARNTGLKNVSGEYIYFFDSDDLIAPETLSNLYSLVDDDIDIVFGKCVITNGQNDNITGYLDHDLPQLKKHYNEDNLLLVKAIEEPLICVAWNRLYKAEFLVKNELIFMQDLLHEDELWFFETLFYANAIILNDTPTYYYNVANVNSISSNFGKRNLESYLNILNHINSNYYENNKLKGNKEAISIYLTHLKIKTLIHCFYKTPSDIQKSMKASVKNTFQNINPKRISKVLNTDLEWRHYYFKVVKSLDIVDILSFLRYYKSKSIVRSFKKQKILLKAKLKNKKQDRVINKSYIK
ncbi:glycosyltransferase family 2 protein [Psychroserpens sp. S379A]|uniref:glycosyltransferase family 2 protein n=1 Tax=Psychroserpens sp. S379A TaxID=3415137 RepID=UPI003C7D0850